MWTNRAIWPNRSPWNDFCLWVWFMSDRRSFSAKKAHHLDAPEGADFEPSKTERKRLVFQKSEPVTGVDASLGADQLYIKASA